MLQAAEGGIASVWVLTPLDWLNIFFSQELLSSSPSLKEPKVCICTSAVICSYFFFGESYSNFQFHSRIILSTKKEPMIQTNLLTLPLQDSQSWVPQSIHNFQARLSVLLAEYVEQHSILQACGAKSRVEPADLDLTRISWWFFLGQKASLFFSCDCAIWPCPVALEIWSLANSCKAEWNASQRKPALEAGSGVSRCQRKN